VHLVQFKVCWHLYISNSCINSIHWYECKYPVLGISNSSIVVHLTFPKCQYCTGIHYINLNSWNIIFQILYRLVLNCILLDLMSLPCTIFPLFYYTSYYFYPYIHISLYFQHLSSLYQHGTFCQPGEVSLFPVEFKSTLCQSACTSIQTVTHSSIMVGKMGSNSMLKWQVR